MPGAADLHAVGAGIRSLRVNPLRTALAVLGVLIGVAALVAVLSLGDGMEGYLRREVARTTGVQAVTVAPRLTREVDGFSQPNPGFPVFTERDAAEAWAVLPGVAGVGLSASGAAVFTAAATGRRYRASVVGVLASLVDERELKLAAGRFFTAPEAARDAPVVVLSHGLAARLAGAAPPERLLEARVRVGGSLRRVVGILEAPEFRDPAYAYVPLRAAREVLPAGPLIAPVLTLRAVSVEEVPALRTRVEDWLAARYGDWEERAEVVSSDERLKQVRVAMLVFRAILGAIAGISLLVGGIGIMNVLLASVAERTREIGVRRAVGARSRDVLLQFLCESLAIAGAGGLVGVPLGLGVAFGVTAALRASLGQALYAGASPGSLLFAAAAAGLVALGFGLYPARRAARISPIDAIRHE